MANNTTEVARLFRDVSQKFKHIMRKSFEDMGITAPQGMVVGSLFKNGEMMVSELSNQLGLTNSTISGILDRLEKQQVIKRERSQTDKRIVYVKLSPQFTEMHQQNFLKIAEANFGKSLDKGTPEEIEKIIEGLNILKRILNESIQ